MTRFASGQPGFLDSAYRIRALAKRFRVIVISEEALQQGDLEIRGVEFQRLPASGGAGRSFLVRWLGYLWRVGRYLRRLRPDRVVLLHSLTAPAVFLAPRTPVALYWNEHPIRFVHWSSEDSPLARAYRKLEYRLLFIEPARRASLVMPIGGAQADDLIESGCAPERVKLIDMGVDESFRRIALGVPSVRESGALRLVYTGTVRPARGRDVMLDAVAAARKRGIPVNLTLVGASADEAAHCVEFARVNRMSEAFSVHGRVPGDRIPSFLAGAHAGLCLWEDTPWWQYNPPTKLFEYLVAGLPVLASRIRTHADYVSDWDNGVLFEYDSADLTRAIEEVWRRRDELPAMAERAAAGAERYLWATIEPVFLDAISTMVRR